MDLPVTPWSESMRLEVPIVNAPMGGVAGGALAAEAEALPAAALEALRTRLRALLPQADEVMSYAMPGFREGGRMIAGYAGYARHCGLYTHSGTVAPRWAQRIEAAGLKWSKSGISFPPDGPVPDDLLADLIALRRAEAGLE